VFDTDVNGVSRLTTNLFRTDTGVFKIRNVQVGGFCGTGPKNIVDTHARVLYMGLYGE